MALVLRSLSDFKRFLAEPGATIQVVRNTFVDRQPASFGQAYRDKGLFEPRTIRALSKKAAVFSVQGHPNTIWLYWDKGTRKWRFHEDTVAIPLDTGLGPPDEIVYRCSYGAAPGTEEPGGHHTCEPERPSKPLAARKAGPTGPTPVMPRQGQGQLL